MFTIPVTEYDLERVLRRDQVDAYDLQARRRLFVLSRGRGFAQCTIDHRPRSPDILGPLHSTKWDKSSPFVKGELNGSRWIRAI